MPTNQQRRDAAKRKLERQLVKRQERQRSRRRQNIIAVVIAGVVAIGAVIWFVTRPKSAADDSASTDTSTASSAETPTAPCVYTPAGADADKAVKAVTVPANTDPLRTGTVDATVTLTQGSLGITLDRSLAPCAVNAFVSLASQKFYDATSCHRLTTDDDLKILQCGDPSGTGRGGPGYSYANEANPPVVSDTSGTSTETSTATPNQYPVGTIAMANTAAGGANGSQFFIVYGESNLGSSGYTKIGTVNADGLAVIEQIAAKGTVAGKSASGALDAPAETVTVTSITVPEDAVGAVEPVATSSETTDVLPTEVLPTDTAATDSSVTEPPASDPAVTDPAGVTPADTGVTTAAQ